MKNELNMLTAAEVTEAYANTGANKVRMPLFKMLLLSILAGFLIGAGANVSNMASHTIDNPSVVRVISGLLFPFGLGMVILMGAELFTGNAMICISVAEKKTSFSGMLKNWLFVYIGNFIGAGLLAVACVYFGQLDHSAGALAAYTIKVANAKSSLPFANALVLGILCNILVCAGVLCSCTAKDTAGRIIGAYIPVAFFVIGGFEHSVANMYYITAGLLAQSVSKYADVAASVGVDTSMLTWGNFIFKNLLPVTIGNIVGGAGVGMLMWAAHIRKPHTNN